MGLERWFDLEETKELVCPAKLKELKIAAPNYIREELHKRLLGELEASPDSLARLNEIAQDLRLDIKSQRLTENKSLNGTTKTISTTKRERDNSIQVLRVMNLGNLSSNFSNLGRTSER